MLAAEATHPGKRLSAGRALVYGALTVALLDIVYAITFWWLQRDVHPMRVFQSVAAGLLGRDAFEGGLPTAVLGGLLHLFNATVIVAVYHLASRRLSLLIRRAVPCGILYGIAVCLVMSYVVIPLSASPAGFPRLWVLGVNLVSHILLVGLPTALFARAAAGSKA